MIKMPKEFVERIITNAQHDLPNESCGMFAGKITNGTITVEKIYPMTNVDQSPEHFSLDPKEQFAVIRDIRSHGLKLLGNYHSHPQTPSRPSQEDIRLAYDSSLIYMILSLASTTPVFKAFHIENSEYTELPMHIA